MDTDAGTRISENKQINDFFEIRDRQTSYTDTFSFPMTENNKRLLKMMSFPGNTSLSQYRVHNVAIYRSGIQTVSDGIGYFKPSNGRYNMFVYSQNIDFFDTIGDRTIADLNLRQLDHILNIPLWRASFNRNDYTYAIADYGKLDGNTIEVNYQAPSLYISYLWKRIWIEAGFNWKYVGRGGRPDYDPFQSDEWKEIAITIDEGFPEEKESVSPIKKLEVSKDKVSQYTDKVINILGNEIVVQELSGQIVEYVRFRSDLDTDNIHIFSNSTQYNRSRFRIRENGFYKIQITGEFYNLNTESVSMYIEKDGYNLYTLKDGFPIDASSLGFIGKVYLRAGDEFFVKFISSPKDDESYYSYNIKMEMWLDNSVTAVNFSSYLSKIKQKDFVKDIFAYLGLIFRRNGDTYEFISMEELLDPLAKYENFDALANNLVYEDWSNKFHRVIEEDSKIGAYARNNIFKYRYDNPEDNFADSVLKIDDQTIDNETTLVERPYKAPDISTANIGSILRQCELYTKELDDDGSVKTVKPNKSEPYFHRIKKVEGSFNYKLAGADGTTTFEGTYPLMTMDDVDFNNILPNRYAALTNTLNYGKKITAELFLTILDIHTLDFFKLKYIKQLGKLYYLNKVKGFQGTGITKVEMIQIRNIEKLGQFSDDYFDDFNT